MERLTERSDEDKRKIKDVINRLIPTLALVMRVDEAVLRKDLLDNAGLYDHIDSCLRGKKIPIYSTRYDDILMKYTSSVVDFNRSEKESLDFLHFTAPDSAQAFEEKMQQCIKETRIDRKLKLESDVEKLLNHYNINKYTELGLDFNKIISALKKNLNPFIKNFVIGGRPYGRLRDPEIDTSKNSNADVFTVNLRELFEGEALTDSGKRLGSLLEKEYQAERTRFGVDVRSVTPVPPVVIAKVVSATPGVKAAEETVVEKLIQFMDLPAEQKSELLEAKQMIIRALKKNLNPFVNNFASRDPALPYGRLRDPNISITTDPNANVFKVDLSNLFVREPHSKENLNKDGLVLLEILEKSYKDGREKRPSLK